VLDNLVEVLLCEEYCEKNRNAIKNKKSINRVIGEPDVGMRAARRCWTRSAMVRIQIKSGYSKLATKVQEEVRELGIARHWCDCVISAMEKRRNDTFWRGAPD
jgi:hypothetical protein